MPKMNRKQKAELHETLKENSLTDEQILKKFKITSRALRYHKTELGLNAGRGQPPKEKEIEIEADVMNADESNEEIKLPEIVDALDAEKNYCAECYKEEKITELTNNAEKCPTCGVLLRW